jgi:hypothetical protein
MENTACTDPVRCYFRRQCVQDLQRVRIDNENFWIVSITNQADIFGDLKVICLWMNFLFSLIVLKFNKIHCIYSKHGKNSYIHILCEWTYTQMYKLNPTDVEVTCIQVWMWGIFVFSTHLPSLMSHKHISLEIFLSKWIVYNPSTGTYYLKPVINNIQIALEQYVGIEKYFLKHIATIIILYCIYFIQCFCWWPISTFLLLRIEWQYTVTKSWVTQPMDIHNGIC